MNPIFWVFGGTAVGKKHFISAAVQQPKRMGFPEGLAAAWYEDGTTDPDAILKQLAESPLIIRWQWGREDLLGKLAEARPDIRQMIYLCVVYPSVQVRRVIEREGSLKWGEPMLIREAQDVRELAERLSMKHSIPVMYVDATRDYLRE